MLTEKLDPVMAETLDWTPSADRAHWRTAVDNLALFNRMTYSEPGLWDKSLSYLFHIEWLYAVNELYAPPGPRQIKLFPSGAQEEA